MKYIMPSDNQKGTNKMIWSVRKAKKGRKDLQLKGTDGLKDGALMSIKVRKVLEAECQIGKNNNRN